MPFFKGQRVAKDDCYGFKYPTHSRYVADTAKLLNKSRTAIEGYRGKQIVVYLNAGKCPANKIREKLKRRVQSLIKKILFLF